jgi:tetratricopeptide (TPR) repeat protein
MSSSCARRMIGVAVIGAALWLCTPGFAQTGGVTGKCTGQDGSVLAGYTVQLDRQEIKWTSHVKTNKKGEYTYIGLAPGMYKLTLKDPSGTVVFFISTHVGLGDPTEVNFDLAKEMASAKKEAEANPEYKAQKAVEEKEQKQFTGLKALFDQGTALYNQKRYTEAAGMYEQALPLAKDKNVPVILARLADSYSKAATVDATPDARKQDQDKALSYYQKALEVNPSDASLHNNLGSLYADMGKVPEAQAEFQKAIDLNPTGAAAYYYNMGVILVNKGKMDEAGVALKKCTDLDPSNANAWYWYGMALMGKAEFKPDGSVVAAPGTIEAFRTYLKLAPTGQWAAASQASVDQLTGKVNTEYKAAKKKKS